VARTSEAIHPFPARMAADIALDELVALPSGSLVLDPMAGSGTVLRVAADLGHRALGFDVDPLAVLMTKVWTTPIDPRELRDAAHEVVAQAVSMDAHGVSLPWIDEDADTRDFVEYWFAAEQQTDLRRLSSSLYGRSGPIGEALKLVLSKIIVTKDRGASLARDVSHSRPRRVHHYAGFAVQAGFLQAANRLARRLAAQPPPGGVEMALGDARDLRGVRTASIDAVVTSPPYLNAIDYLRGHRLALVWLGYRVGDLRGIRASSIGSERAPEGTVDIALTEEIKGAMGSLGSLPTRVSQMVDRYVLDVAAALGEVFRVLRPGGRAVFVIGNSSLKGVFIENAAAVRHVAQRLGFELIREHERDLPPNRRYLPPPATASGSDLRKRLRTETVLTYRRA